MPRSHILKKHVNQSKSTVKDKPVLGDGNTTPSWQPKTSNVALKRHDTPISPTEVYASICYNNTLENQSGKCFLKFFNIFCASIAYVIAHMCTASDITKYICPPTAHYCCIIQVYEGFVIVNYSTSMGSCWWFYHNSVKKILIVQILRRGFPCC